jgi:hypothetical protein
MDVNRPAAISSYVLLGTVAVLSFIVQPAIVQGFVTHLHVSESRAVELVGLEMGGVALATIVAALLGNRLNWPTQTAIAILIAAAGNLASALLTHSAAFGLVRLVAGFGHGGIMSLSFTFVGLTRRVDRNLAIYLVSLLTYGAVVLWLAPVIFNVIGLEGLFTAFAVVALASLATLRFLPTFGAAHSAATASTPRLGMTMLCLALGGVLAYNLAQGISWATLFLIGVAAGMAEQSVANALFVSQIVAVGGALAAVFLAGRMHRGLPIAVGIIAGTACIALLLGTPSAAMFLIAVCGFNFLWNFVMPFILGAVGSMGAEGRMMSPAIAMQMIGLGLGPILSARLIGDASSYRSVELWCIGCFVASLVMFAPPLLAQRAQLSANSATVAP